MNHQLAQPRGIGRTLAESTPAFDRSPRPEAGAPNVVMIVLDDLGFAQLGCFGSDIATPGIDKLAERGLRYNSFHVTALCTPTRACLLTGRNQHRVGMGFLAGVPMGFPGYNARIPKSAGTLPRLLRDGGYSTLAVGKWHLTPVFEEGPAGPFARWPLGMGFDRYYGFVGGMTNQWTPDLVQDNALIEPPASPEEGYHLTEDLASQAIRLVQDQQQAAPHKPFFLYFATAAPHSPHHVPKLYVEPYSNQFNDGWDVWRERTFQKQLRLGIAPRGTSLTQRPSWVRPWEDLTSDERLLFARQMETYAGFLSHTDAQIRRVITFLADIGVLDNTLIIVVSDNGASGDGGPEGHFNRMDVKGDNAEFMVAHIDDLGGFRAYNHYAWGWAWAGNSPFQLWKRYTWLGGVRAPLIIQWPEGISADDTGQVRTQFCHAVDLLPTILETTGVGVPDVLDGVSQQPMDGRSLLPTLRDADAPSPRATQYFECMGSRSIYHEGWKATTDHVDSSIRAENELVEGSHDFETDQWSLFYLEDDFSEAHNIAAGHPKRLRHMIELWWLEAGRNQVLPLMDGVGRSTGVEPPPDIGRQQWIYRPNGGPIVTPSPFRSGFRLIADIDISNDCRAAGVICAQGDWNGGWACYVLDGRLVLAFNFGVEPQRIVAEEAISPGRHEVAIRYRPGSGRDGSGSVTLDGQEICAGPVYSAELSMVLRGRMAAGRLRIGRDHGFPVCDDYRPPFPFTGGVDRIVLEFAPTSERPGSSQELKNALGRE